jgi:outer membrane protein assembly factor BamA
LGGFYLPKINSISSYFKRITYRAGIRLEDTGILVSNNDSNNNFTAVNDFGISFGLGLPLKQMSSLNISLEYGQRGTTDNNLIKENYFNVGLSLSLTASGFQAWFRERRID